jgi:oligopeptide transport system ATP-binding protein
LPFTAATAATAPAAPTAPIFSIGDLNVEFAHRNVTIEAVRQVSLSVSARECVGIVGESGSGKTQVFMAAMGLLPVNAAARGRVRFEDEDLLGSPPARLNRIRGSKLTMIFQDPMTSLTPHLTVGTQLAEVLVCHGGSSWSGARIAARRMLERVRVPEPQRRMNQYPHELSGGLRQRVIIGMSLLCEPALVIADEPTTALDVTVQAQIIDLLRGMREELGMALVLISHDLGVVAGLADRILVMYAGRIVESGTSEDIFGRALHPYTAELLKCVPSLSGPRLERLPTIAGQPPRPGENFEGCAFAPRCPRAAQRCRVERPSLEGMGNDEGARGDAPRRVACHFPLPP